MGCCEAKQNLKNNGVFQKINEDNTIVDAFKIKGIMFSNIEKCVCKIIRKTKTGSGFFCEIPEKNIKLLITNNHVLDKVYLEQGNKIAYMISENENEKFYEIDLEIDRYKLTNKENDFTIIEILKEDNVQHFLKINNEKYEMEDEIFSYEYAGGIRLGFSFGNLLKKGNNELKYNVGTKGGSSGSPLLLMKNSKVIGLHKGCYFNAKNEKINLGVPIEIILNKLTYIKCTYEILDYNLTQIINNTDGNEINKDIESKIKIINNGIEEKLIFTKKFDKIGINVIYFVIQNKLNDMSFLFNNCTTLKKIEFNSLETDNVTNMKLMFQSCHNLEYLNLTNFNTSKVINMSRMFNCCNKLKQIEGISNFDTSKVTNMKDMFKYCSELEYLNLSNFNLENVTDIDNKELIFYGCNKLKQIKGIEKFDKIQNNNNKKNENPNLQNQKTKDEKSIRSNNSYNYTGNNYDYYDRYSYSYSDKDKDEVKKCKCCDRSLGSKDFLSDECEQCYYDEGDA